MEALGSQRAVHPQPMTNQRHADMPRSSQELTSPRKSPDQGTSGDPGAYRTPSGTSDGDDSGGVGPKDVRVAAVATQPGPVRGGSEGSPPEGHREGEDANDDRLREAARIAELIADAAGSGAATER